jgi:small subunit ribosomal protein S18
LPRRRTGVTAKMQRRLSIAIKRARHLALLPGAPGHTRS